MICNIHNCNSHLFFVGFLCFSSLLSWTTGRSFLLLRVNEWTILSHFTFIFLEVFTLRTLSIITPISFFVVETRTTTFFSRWTFPCLSGILSCCWVLSFLPGLLDRFPLPFPFFAGSCSKEHFPPFAHEPFDVQERQLCLALFLANQHVLPLLLEDVMHHSH